MGVSIVKLTSDNETLAEGKVIILYILNKLPNPVSNESLYKLVLSINDMNYFYFQQFLLDLINNKYIEFFNNGIHTIYKITTLGKNVLELTEDILPVILKLQIDTELTTAKNESSVIAEYTPRSENNYVVSCKIIENNECCFELKTTAPSREQAKKIVNNWENNSNKIYGKILSILTQEN